MGTRRTSAQWGRWPAAALLALVAACGDEGHLRSVDGRVAASTALDFGPVLVGDTVEREVEVENLGQAPLRILGALPVSLPPDFDVRTREVVLEPGAKKTISVRFSPGELGQRDGFFRLRTDSRLTPDMAITVTGRGVNASGLPDTTVIDFGNVPVLDAETRTLTLANAGEVAAQAVVGAPAGLDQDLFTASRSGRLAVPPTGTLGISIHFRPTRLGPADAWVTVRPCPTCAELTVRLVGNGVASVLRIDPQSVDFGFAPVGGAPMCRTVTLENIGSATVGFQGVDLAPGTPAVFSVQPAAATDIQPGDKVQATVCFQPTSFAQENGAFRFLTSDTRAPRILVPLAGSGGGPEVECVPLSLDYGTQILGAIKTLQVLCTNLGGDLPGGGGELILKKNTATTLGTRILGDAEFSVILPNDVRLLSGESYSLSVRYQPMDENADLGKLILVTNDADELEIEVSLRGTAREAAPCELQVVPARVDFGMVAVGAQPILDFQVQNTGSDACVLSDLDLTAASDPAFRLIKGPLPSTTIYPGDRLRVPVQFEPSASGDAEGAVEFYVNRASDPLVVVPLRAVAGQGCVKVSPQSLLFGKVGVDCSAQAHAVALTNTCTLPAMVDSILLGGGTSTEFRIDSPAATRFSVQPGEVVQVLVSYDPDAEGNDSAPLYVNVSGEPAPTLVSLAGTGDANPNQTDTFLQESRPQADVLFVMDNSGSMMEEQNGLGRGFPQFMAAALAENWDFHIAVTTTGIRQSAPSCPGGADGGEAGRLFPVDGSSPRIITPGTPDPQGVFRANISVGLCHWWEEGLEGGYLALSEPLLSAIDDVRTAVRDDGNGGFLRPDARLSVIYISDEDDYSSRPVQDYVNHLFSLKPGRPELVKASAIVSDGSCTTASSTGTRYMEVVLATGGVVASICSPDWSAVLENIAGATFTGRSRFPLSRTPATLALVVTVDGAEVPEFLADGSRSWIYDASDNSVVFASGHIPAAGTAVQITYPVACQ